MIKEFEAVTFDLDKILALDGEITRALKEHRMDDFYRLSSELCVRASTMAREVKRHER